jgi:type II secretory pathway pseudopilin PulG
MMITVAVFSVIAAGAAPVFTNATDGLKLGQAAREVERELQTARLMAVTSNRPIRVRFNCPATGQYRMVELIGSAASPVAADTTATRCQESLYKSPANDANPLTRPNHDGPVKQLPAVVSFGSASTVEFWPDGSVHQDLAGGTTPWPVVPGTGTAITLTKGSKVSQITVNGLGKITLVQ